MLPLGHQQVDPGVLGLDGGLGRRRVHGLRGGTLSCGARDKRFHRPGRQNGTGVTSLQVQQQSSEEDVTQRAGQMAGVTPRPRGPSVWKTRTSVSSFAQHWDLRVALGFHGGLALVRLGDLVDIGLLPGHFLHERLWRHGTRRTFSILDRALQTRPAAATKDDMKFNSLTTTIWRSDCRQI